MAGTLSMKVVAMNPYKILNIDHRASKHEIISAAALALRERKYSGREIAEAQKELLDPVSKAAHDFLQFMDLSPLMVRPARPAPLAGDTRLGEMGKSRLTHLSIFDESL